MNKREKTNERIEIKQRKWFFYKGELTDHGGTRWLIFYKYEYNDGFAIRKIEELLEGTRLGATLEEAETQAILARNEHKLDCRIAA